MKTFAGRFGIGQWSFIGQGSEKKWYPSENSPQGAWDHVAEEMLLLFVESGHPIFRSTTPLSRGQLQSKGKGKMSIHFTADQDTVDTIYRIILSVNQLSVYGAVAAICEEYEGHPDSTGEPVILVGQSIVLGDNKAEVPVHDAEPRDAQIVLPQYFQLVGIGKWSFIGPEPVFLEGQSIVLGKIKAEAPAHDEDPRNNQIIWRQYIQQVESLSPENRLRKFCEEAGFLRVVEDGQYFVTRKC